MYQVAAEKWQFCDNGKISRTDFEFAEVASNNTTQVGDGMNDVPSLSIADVGVGLHRDSAPAVMGASITILNSKLDSVGLLYRMADLTMQQMHFNLLFNFAYNAVALVFASGLMQPFGLDLTPYVPNPRHPLEYGSLLTNLSDCKRQS